MASCFVFLLGGGSAAPSGNEMVRAGVCSEGHSASSPNHYPMDKQKHQRACKRASRWMGSGEGVGGLVTEGTFADGGRTRVSSPYIKANTSNARVLLDYV